MSGAAVAASQLHAGPAHAGHDSSNTFHLGAANTAPVDAATSLVADVEDAGLAVDNQSTSASTGVRGTGSDAGVEGISVSGIGVLGRRTSAVDDDGLSGVRGEAALGNGVFGHADRGTGVTGEAAEGNGVAGFGGSGPSEGNAGVIGFGFIDHGVVGQSEDPTKAGVLGASLSCLNRGSEDPEDPCNQPSLGTGVLGLGQAGTGVRGESDTGTGVEAESGSGLALRVLGRAGFSSAGTGTVPAGQSSTFVADDDVLASSHVLVVLTSNPGPRHLHYVVPTTGGFTVHLSQASARQRPATTFSYLAIQTA